MTADQLTGRRYGPVAYEVSRTAAADFVAATGDDPDRWQGVSPPSLAAAVLFAVAPALLADPDVVPFTRSVVHTDQRFRWLRPLGVGEVLETAGMVAGVRSRGGAHLVTFEVAAGGADGPWLESSSTFLLSDRAAGESPDEPEPPHDLRAGYEPALASPLPPEGSEIPALRRSASRADLVRYAAAARDWNPIHWDHEAARLAGLPGVVVHGLLMASWLAQAASRHAPGPAPVASMRARFRRPLRPAVPAVVCGRVASADREGADLSLEVRAGDTALVTASMRVTR
jgi:acyl dehydratase